MIAWRVFCAIIKPANGTACSRWRHGPRGSRLAGAASTVLPCVSLCQFRTSRGSRWHAFLTFREGARATRAIRMCAFSLTRRRRWSPSPLLINCCGLSCRERPSPLVRSLHNFLVPSPRVSRGECECDRTSSMSYAFAISSGEVYNCFPNQHIQASKPHFVEFLLRRIDDFFLFYFFFPFLLCPLFF